MVGAAVVALRNKAPPTQARVSVSPRLKHHYANELATRPPPGPSSLFIPKLGQCTQGTRRAYLHLISNAQVQLEADSPFRRAITNIKWGISRSVKNEALRLVPSLSSKWSVGTRVLGRSNKQEGDTLCSRDSLALVQGELGPPRVDKTAPGSAAQHCKSPGLWGLGKQMHSSHSRHVLESGGCSHFIRGPHLQRMQVI